MTRAPYSNYGGCVDLFAPGSDITSAGYGDDTATAVLSGTSMATAHVAGAAALVLAANPTWTPSQAGAELLGNATIGVVYDACNNSPNRLLDIVTGTAAPQPAAANPSSDGRVTFYNKGSLAINLVVILEGYFTAVPGAGFHLRPLACRLLNSRTAGTGQPLAAGAALGVQVAVLNGVPSTGVAGAMLNLTVTPQESGYLMAWPTGQAEPSLTLMDFNAGVWRTNGVVLRSGAGGKIHLVNGSSGTIHLIVDIQGWFEGPRNAGAVTVMPLGDSITWGQGSNAAVPAIVAAKGDHVRLVDMTNVTTADLVDTLHPNDTGYAKMSDRWYPVLTGVLGN